jgi:hypothetical protein
MADLSHVTAYTALERHRQEMGVATRQRRWRMLLMSTVVIVVSAAGYWVTPPLGLMLVGIGAMVLFFSAITGGSSVPHHVMAGVEGEARVLDALAELPDDHVIFNQVHIPDPQLPNGRRELDFVIVGPSAVTIVEVKNTPGLIHVDPDQKRWKVVKRAGCGSSPGWNAIDNPLLQVRGQVRALERWLLEHGVAQTPRAMVCFARPESAIAEPERADPPVVTTSELLEHIKATQSGREMPPRDRQVVVRLLGRAGNGTIARAA